MHDVDKYVPFSRAVYCFSKFRHKHDLYELCIAVMLHDIGLGIKTLKDVWALYRQTNLFKGQYKAGRLFLKKLTP